MRFPRVLGQARAERILGRLLELKRVPSALLFIGPAGVGKTLMAHEFAKALLCQDGSACGLCPECVSIDKGIHPDVKEVNARYQATLLEEEEAKQKSLRVKTIRHLRGDMEMMSFLGSWKVAIIEEAHTLELEAANCLLKILEEPAEKTLWILVTSQRDRLIKTVQSRCFPVVFSSLPTSAVAQILRKNGAPPESAELAEGQAGRALELAADPEELTLEALKADPLAAMASADALPREAYLARDRASRAIAGLTQELRLKHLRGGVDFAKAEGALRRLVELRRALASNADPRLVLTLAGEAAKGS